MKKIEYYVIDGQYAYYCYGRANTFDWSQAAR